MSKSISALAPWYGGARMIAPHVGKALEGCNWVGVLFGGGMSEVRHITARTVVVNDLHCSIINVARVLASELLGAKLIRRLRRLLFHPKTLTFAQWKCKEFTDLFFPGDDGKTVIPTEDEMLDWAENYFVCAWMARNGTAGTDGEFDTGISMRWEAGGGDSAKRFRNATEALLEWRRVTSRCTFTCMDVFEFLPKVKDEEGIGLYADPPWVGGDGDSYVHKFTSGDHVALEAKLRMFEKARVVVRLGDHPVIRQLYLEQNGWRWTKIDGRTQANGVKKEVLIVRN